MAASSSTEPRLRCRNRRSAAADQSASVALDLASAPHSAASATAVEPVVGDRLRAGPRRPGRRARRGCRSAASLSVVGGVGRPAGGRPAPAPWHGLIAGSVSLAERAFERRPARPGSRIRNSESAALAGVAPDRTRAASAARSRPRWRGGPVVDLDRLEAARRARLRRLAPVARSRSVPSSAFDEQRLVGTDQQAGRRSSACSTAAAAGSPVAASGATPCSISAKLAAEQCRGIVERRRPCARRRADAKQRHSASSNARRSRISARQSHAGSLGLTAVRQSAGQQRSPRCRPVAQCDLLRHRAAALAGLDVEVAAATAARASRRSGPSSLRGSRTIRRPTTRPEVCQTVLNWPSAWISPISTGLVM